MQEILLSILGGGVAVTIVEAVKEAIMWNKNRKAQKEDKAEEKEDKQIEKRIEKLETQMNDLPKMIQNLVDSQKNVLFDRILYLCRHYISAGEIEFDDLRNVNALHHSYHDGLGGNGDLDSLMNQVSQLPLKAKKG